MVVVHKILSQVLFPEFQAFIVIYVPCSGRAEAALGKLNYVSNDLNKMKSPVCPPSWVCQSILSRLAVSQTSPI